ncbi:hypothetical protein IscW_ISCW010151 [Ixodes scapularis]|uniref:Uncharacterized protein n=1 Tax=Ixodes scapularis TaxID=6945 RepID=B7Q0L1_IXOSC|nr:hypothetical protein IscW_ISCW010151 [Ixodes scapularis]|eukprot:XP_002407969.1 hypothetical protein IscW_ISCW010151 [Ixodes scapularis]
MRTVLCEALDAADCVASQRQQFVGETRLACAAVPKRSERGEGPKERDRHRWMSLRKVIPLSNKKMPVLAPMQMAGGALCKLTNTVFVFFHQGIKTISPKI